MTTSKGLVLPAKAGSGFVTASVHQGPAGPPMTMAFPCYAGPALRGLTTVLLYRGKIHVSVPTLLEEEQYLVFRKAGDYALKRGHSCLEAFALANHHFLLAVEQSLAEQEALAPLGHHFEFLQIVNDGSPDWYGRALKDVDSSRLAMFQSALTDVQQLNVASREFIWRIFSAHLNFDADLARMVDYVEHHLKARGSTEGLLAESLLNRYMLLGDGAASVTAFATQDERTAQILSHLARDAASQETSSEDRSDLLAFVLFDELLGEHVGSLVPPNVERVAKLLSDRSRELRAMRERCRREASQLVGDAMEPNAFVRRVTTTLENCREEASALLDTTRSAFSKMVRALMESGTFCTSLAALAGTVIGGVHAAIPGVLAAGVAGQIVSATAKSHNEKRDVIRTSHWSFVYYAQHPQ